MNIGYFITHYPYEKYYDDYFCGGTGEVAINLAKEMVNSGHEVFIFTTSRTNKFEFEEQDGVKIFRSASTFRLAEANISLRLLFEPLKYKVDIVHTHMGNAPAPIAAFIYSLLRNKTLITTYHGDQQYNYGSLIRRLSIIIYSKLFIKMILKSSKYIISPTKIFINQSKLLATINKEMMVIPNGINLAEFDSNITEIDCRDKLNLPLTKNIILSLGSVNENKGPHILIKAIDMLVNEGYKDILLVIVGDGLFRAQLEKLVDDINMTEYVRFDGYQLDKYAYYKAADIFVLPSIMKNEIFGIVNLEAMAMGVPIIASDIGGVPEIVKDKETGLLVPPNNPEKIANAIMLLINNPQLSKTLSENGLDAVKNYSWSGIAEKTIELYMESIK